MLELYHKTIMKIRRLLPVIGIVILAYILTTIDVETIISVFFSIRPIYLFLSFLSLVPILLITDFEWQLILKKQKISVGYSYTLKNILIGYFYGFITPGGFGGYTRTLYLQNESRAPLQKCVSNIIILNTVDYITLLFIGIIGGVLVRSRFPNLFYLTIILFIVVSSLFLLFLKKETLTSFLKKILQHKTFDVLRDRLNLSIDSFFVDMPNPRGLFIPFIVSFLGWILRFSEFYLISKLFFIEVPYIYFVLMVAIAGVVASLPITIYGLGTREMMLISLFSIFGIAPERIVSLSLFWFVIVWLLPSILGAIVAIKEKQIS